MNEILESNPPAVVVIADHATGNVQVIDFSSVSKANSAHPTIINMAQGIPLNTRTNEGLKVTNALFPANESQTIYHATRLETMKSDELK